jgi:p-cumate 2,3-dioxygenase beta subunit
VGDQLTATGLCEAVAEFLFVEAELLDDWRLSEWGDLFTEDAHYYVPAPDRVGSDPATTIYFVADDMPRLRSRIKQLCGKHAHAENPRSRTRRLVTNVRVREVSGDTLRVTSNFAVHRFRGDVADSYVGRYDHLLVRLNGTFRIQERTAWLEPETLRAQGKLSIIL